MTASRMRPTTPRRIHDAALGRARTVARNRPARRDLRGGCPLPGAGGASAGLLSVAILASRVQSTCQKAATRRPPASHGPSPRANRISLSGGAFLLVEPGADDALDDILDA